MFPKRCNTGTISYVEGERVPKNWVIVTERIREVFDWFMNSTVENGGMKELEFGGALPCISGRGELILLGKLVDLGILYVMRPI